MKQGLTQRKILALRLCNKPLGWAKKKKTLNEKRILFSDVRPELNEQTQLSLQATVRCSRLFYDGDSQQLLLHESIGGEFLAKRMGHNFPPLLCRCRSVNEVTTNWAAG